MQINSHRLFKKLFFFSSITLKFLGNCQIIRHFLHFPHKHCDAPFIGYTTFPLTLMAIVLFITLRRCTFHARKILILIQIRYYTREPWKGCMDIYNSGKILV